MTTSRSLIGAFAILLAACSSGGGGYYYGPSPDMSHPVGPGNDGGAMCMGAQVMCSGVCVTTASDPSNCGACGKACSGGQTCQNSVCTGGNTCNAPKMTCNGACIDPTSDPMNCGGCGTTCSNGQTCQNAECVGGNQCNPPMTSCNGSCVDTTSDVMNCGGCGNACVNGQSCTNGACVAQMMMGVGGCAPLVQCTNACMDQQCDMTCEAMASKQALQLFTALITCVFTTACPSTNGGICDMTAMNYNDNNCNTCAMTAQTMGGKCFAQYTSCANSM